ncbi:MAG: SDR family NAD(P)-dependent oxidoreductase, partial [Armatimonadetes bacterium]|nr:SDR family NAD(P)-dependent oxidoreductase [Armatimonadota bacterium]
MSSLVLEGKVALVTGASRGIGEAIAGALAEAGADLVIAARKREGLDAAAERLRGYGRRVLPVATHVGYREECLALVGAAEAEFGRVDVLVNNAATNPHYGPLLTAEDSHWEKSIQVNLMGYFWLIQAVVPGMAARGSGKIVNVASIAGQTAIPGMGVYGITKAAVI